MSRKNKNVFMYLSLVLFFVGYMILAKGINFSFLGTQNGEAYMNFFFGCFLCEFYKRLTEVGRKWLGVFSGGILLSVGILSCFYGFSVIVDDARILFTILLCPSIIMAAIEISIVKRILQIKLFQFIGTVSMSIMLWHKPLMDIAYVYWFRNPPFSLLQPEVSFVVYMVLLFAVSIISYYVFEKYNVLYKSAQWIREKSRPLFEKGNKERI